MYRKTYNDYLRPRDFLSKADNERKIRFNHRVRLIDYAVAIAEIVKNLPHSALSEDINLLEKRASYLEQARSFLQESIKFLNNLKNIPAKQLLNYGVDYESAKLSLQCGLEKLDNLTRNKLVALCDVLSKLKYTEVNIRQGGIRE